MRSAGRGGTGNLPVESTSFVGRRRERADVARLLTRARLVTLSGMGGTGKTRLALRAIADLDRRFPQGLWFVDLTVLPSAVPATGRTADVDLLAGLVAGTLRLPEQPGVPALRLLANHLAESRTLLVFDNCEHLLPACAVLVNALLAACAHLTIVATSREPLGVAGELLYPVPPLPTPHAAEKLTNTELLRSEAVALFVSRAQAAMPAFTLTDANRAAVVQICRRLDGLPLAIELAAARIRVLEPQQILDRLADRFALLTRGAFGLPPRQQTLHACIDWSFGLCTEAERCLWARLSVFAAGFELEAVEGICADESLPEAGMLDVVAGLVDKSILVRYGRDGPAWYRMLETIRDFGQVQLRTSDAQHVLGRRHRDWYERLVRRLRAEWIGERQAYWSTRMDRERPNLRAAIEYCLDQNGEAEVALRFVVSLPFCFWGRGLFTEGRRWLDTALARATASTPLRARSLVLDAQLALAQGDTAAGGDLLQEGQELAERLGDGAALARALFTRGVGTTYHGDMAGAADLLERALAVLSAPPGPDLDTRLDVLHSLGVVATWMGDYERAMRCHEAVLEVTRPRGEGDYQCRSVWGEGLVAWRRGDLRQAERLVVDSLRIVSVHQLEDRYITGWCLETLACITAARGRYRRAAVLLGAAQAIWTILGTPIMVHRHMYRYHEECERQAHEALGSAAFRDAVSYGQSLAYDAAISYALDKGQPAPGDAPAPVAVPAQPPADRGAADRGAGSRQPAELTDRERQVADLVTRGMTNRQIASDLFISQRTVETHVENILVKLGCTNRAQLAAWVAGQQADDPGGG